MDADCGTRCQATVGVAWSRTSTSVTRSSSVEACERGRSEASDSKPGSDVASSTQWLNSGCQTACSLRRPRCDHERIALNERAVDNYVSKVDSGNVKDKVFAHLINIKVHLHSAYARRVIEKIGAAWFVERGRWDNQELIPRLFAIAKRDRPANPAHPP